MEGEGFREGGDRKEAKKSGGEKGEGRRGGRGVVVYDVR